METDWWRSVHWLLDSTNQYFSLASGFMDVSSKSRTDPYVLMSWSCGWSPNSYVPAIKSQKEYRKSLECTAAVPPSKMTCDRQLRDSFSHFFPLMTSSCRSLKWGVKNQEDHLFSSLLATQNCFLQVVFLSPWKRFSNNNTHLDAIPRSCFFLLLKSWSLAATCQMYFVPSLIGEKKSTDRVL